MLSTASQSSAVNSSAGARRMIPALLTRMSRRPICAMQPSITPRALSGVVPWRSYVMACVRRPSAAIAPQVSSGGRRSSAATSAPASASPNARPCPSPCAPPVTSATLSSSLKLSRIIELRLNRQDAKNAKTNHHRDTETQRQRKVEHTPTHADFLLTDSPCLRASVVNVLFYLPWRLGGSAVTQ